MVVLYNLHWYHQPRRGRALAEPGLGDAELASAGGYAVACHADPALTGRPRQETAAVRVGRERRHSPPAPVADGVHEETEHKAEGCRPTIFGGGEAIVRRRRVVRREG